MILLRCLSPGHWESDDGRVLVSLDPDFLTECDGPHPVKHSAAERARTGTSGHYCYGNEQHTYARWTARVDGDWTEDVYETFAGAREAVEEIVGPVKLVRAAAVAPAPVVPALSDEDADELRALDENIARMTAALDGEDGPFIDRDLLAQNRRRRAELVS